MFYAQNPASLYATSTVVWVDFEKGSEVSTRVLDDSGVNGIGASFATERVFGRGSLCECRSGLEC